LGDGGESEALSEPQPGSAQRARHKSIAKKEFFLMASFLLLTQMYFIKTENHPAREVLTENHILRSGTIPQVLSGHPSCPTSAPDVPSCLHPKPLIAEGGASQSLIVREICIDIELLSGDYSKRAMFRQVVIRG
jgi:hypothetical protein